MLFFNAKKMEILFYEKYFPKLKCFLSTIEVFLWENRKLQKI